MIDYISIDSILFDLSNSLDEKYWEENKMREWATKGFLKMHNAKKYINKVVCLPIVEHKSKLPSDTKIINQILYKEDITTTEELLTEVQSLTGIPDPDTNALSNSTTPTKIIESAYPYFKNQWKTMKTSNANFVGKENEDYPTGLLCAEYGVDVNKCLTTNLRSGYMLISYKGLPTDDSGTYLIPNQEDLKDALYHFCLYRLWDSRANIKEEGAGPLRDHNLRMYQTLKAKASAFLNQPDEGEMENIKNERNRLSPSSYKRSQGWSTLGNPVNEDWTRTAPLKTYY